MFLKRCSKCFQEKPLESFYDRPNGGKRHNCIECHIKTSNFSKEKRRQHSSEQARVKHLWKEYRLSAADYNKMLLKQEGRCTLCGVHQDELEEPLAVDHIHGTTYIRDLLCSSCNTGIGHLKDKPELLRKAANYIERYNAIQEQEDREVPKPIRTGHKPTTETET